MPVTASMVPIWSVLRRSRPPAWLVPHGCTSSPQLVVIVVVMVMMVVMTVMTAMTMVMVVMEVA